MWGKSAKTKKHRNITEWRKGMNASPIKLQYYLRRSDNVDGLVSDPSFTRAAPEQKGLAWKSISSSSVWSKVWRRTMNGAVIYQTDHTHAIHTGGNDTRDMFFYDATISVQKQFACKLWQSKYLKSPRGVWWCTRTRFEFHGCICPIRSSELTL